MVNLEGPLLLIHFRSPRERDKLLNSSVLTYGIISALPQCARLTVLTQHRTLPSLHDTKERFFKRRREKQLPKGGNPTPTEVTQPLVLGTKHLFLFLTLIKCEGQKGSLLLFLYGNLPCPESTSLANVVVFANTTAEGLGGAGMQEFWPGLRKPESRGAKGPDVQKLYKEVCNQVLQN